MTTDQLELEIVGVANGGDGIGHEPDGRVVFVPRTTTGDRVVARISQRKKRYARGQALEVLRPSAARVDAPCPHYADCGGCQLQHIGYGEQLALKRTMLADALERLGGIAIPVPDVRPAGSRLGYRNRIAPTVDREGGRVLGGFRRLDERDAVEDVGDCLLAEEPVRRAWKALRMAWGDAGEALPGSGRLRVTIRATRAGEVGVLVSGGRGKNAGRPDDVAAAIPGLRSYCWHDSTDREHVLWGDEYLEETWGGIRFRLPPDTFLQVNREEAQRIDSLVDDLVGPPRARRLIDLYAGVGARAIRWAVEGADVLACESDGRAVEAGREAARTHGAELSFVEGRVEDILPSLRSADAIVVNPPRKGLSTVALAGIDSIQADRLVYVSCDAATLARDAAALSSGWALVGVQPFDAFPQTAHIETVAWFDARDTVGGNS